MRERIHGSLNVSIPLYIENWNRCSAKRVLIRFPLLYKVGESAYPGNADEKLRCEAVLILRSLAFGDLDLLGVRPYSIQTHGAFKVEADNDCSQFTRSKNHARDDQGDLVLRAMCIMVIRFSSTLPLYKPS